MQQRAETLDDALIRELLESRTERAHLHKTSSRAQVQEQCDGVGEEPGVVTSAAKVNGCSGDKLNHHLCLHCRFFSHFTSFLGTFCFWHSQNEGQEANNLRETLIDFGFSQTKPLFCTKTTSLALR